MTDDNGWIEYKREVLHRLDRLEASMSGCHERNDAKLDQLTIAITELKAQRGVAKWISGLAVPAVVAAVIAYLTRH